MTDEVSPERQNRLPDGEGIPGLLAECVETARAAAASLHPRRLVVGLLAILAITQIGGLHDRLAGPRFGPVGLFADDPAGDLEASVERWRDRLGAAVRDGTLGEREPFDVAAATPWELLEEARARCAVSFDESGDRRADAESAERRSQILSSALRSDRPLGTFEAVSIECAASFGRFCRAVVVIEPRTAAEALGTLLIAVPSAVWRHDRLFPITVVLPASIICALLGGMVSRMAACRFARRQWLTLGESADFMGASWRRLVVAPLLPLAASLVPLGLVALLGLLLAVPVLDVVAGVLFGVSLGLGLVAGILLVGLAVGWPLIVPAIACEEADAADCVQRAYAEPFNRFGRYLVLLVASLLGLAVAVAVLDAVLLATFWAVGLAVAGTAPEWVGAVLSGRAWLEFGAIPATSPNVAGWSVDAVATWITLARMLIGALAFAWFFDAGVRIHLFLRRAVDRVRPEEIAEAPGALPRAERIREAIEAARRSR